MIYQVLYWRTKVYCLSVIQIVHEVRVVSRLTIVVKLITADPKVTSTRAVCYVIVGYDTNFSTLSVNVVYRAVIILYIDCLNLLVRNITNLYNSLGGQEDFFSISYLWTSREPQNLFFPKYFKCYAEFNSNSSFRWKRRETPGKFVKLENTYHL